MKKRTFENVLKATKSCLFLYQTVSKIISVELCKTCTKKLQNVTTFLQTNVRIANKSRQQKAPAIKKLQNCKCDTCCRFADRALQAKNAQTTSENRNFDGRLKRNRDEPNGQKRDNSNRWPNKSLLKAFKAPKVDF